MSWEAAHRDSPWPAGDAQLTELWNRRGPNGECLTTTAIGLVMGLNKNKVVGRAHRLDLPARPSPIRRDPDVTSERSAIVLRRAAATAGEHPTLPPLPSTVADADAGLPVVILSPGGRIGPRVQPKPAQRPRPPPAPTRPAEPAPKPRPYGRIVECCWPMGEPGTREFRWCADPSEPGRSYCEPHCTIAYVKVRNHAEPMAGTGALLAGTEQ